MPLPRSVSAARVTVGAGRAQLFHAGHEREHDPQRSMRGRAQQGTELGLEELLEREAEPDAAQAERRPRALDAVVLDPQLRLADVEGPHRDARAAGALDELTVDGILRVFGQR